MTILYFFITTNYQKKICLTINTKTQHRSLIEIEMRLRILQDIIVIFNEIYDILLKKFLACFHWKYLLTIFINVQDFLNFDNTNKTIGYHLTNDPQ